MKFQAQKHRLLFFLWIIAAICDRLLQYFDDKRTSPSYSELQFEGSRLNFKSFLKILKANAKLISLGHEMFDAIKVIRVQRIDEQT